MAAIRGVISTLSNDGQEAMGPDILMYHYPDSSIVSGTLLTVESNHFAVLKSRGAVLDVYETVKGSVNGNAIFNSRIFTFDLLAEEAHAWRRHPGRPGVIIKMTQI